MARRLSTGIDVLDRMLEGGIPAGSVVAFTAAPASQSELFLYELTANRRTLYLSTHRSAGAVHDALERTRTPTGEPNVQEIGGDAPLDDTHHQIRALPDQSNLIIDPIDPLERAEHSRYQRFLNTLQTHMVNTESLAFLHSLDGNTVPKGRDMTEYIADVVFHLSTSVQGDAIVNRLSVPKFRGGRALEEPIKLNLSDRVSIDTSRDIA